MADSFPQEKFSRRILRDETLLVLALSLPVIGYGVIYHVALAAVGVVVLLAAVFGWALEPSSAPRHVAPDEPTT